MCRIAGLLNAGIPSHEAESRVLQMCRLQQHGGPDDEGVFVSPDGQVILGNRRLALVDLSSAGHQPMHYKDRFVITYNGEIYNFKELRSELEILGHTFHNHSDTEVILAAFAEWHTQCFSKFNGMFAFAIYDKLEHQVFLVRDPAGIKPLYYGIDENTLVFASEVRAFKSSGIIWEHDTHWPVLLMAYGHIPEPYTGFKKIRALHKGAFLQFDLNKSEINIQSFRHFNFTSKFDSKHEVLQTLREELQKAVKRHLISDAPVGVFLSGGLDSGVLAALSFKCQPQYLKTLSIFFEEKEYSEKQYQDLIFQYLGSDLSSRRQFLLTQNDFENSFPSVVASMDLPSCDGVNTWFISRYAKDCGLKAVLSGIGADELFGGYPSFRRINKANALKLISGRVTRYKKRSDFKQLNRISYLSLDGMQGVYLFLRGHFTVFEIARHLDATEAEVWDILNEQPKLGFMHFENNQNQASWLEFNLYMQNQLLRDADVMSMIHGLEIRVPFLDLDLVKCVMSIHPSIKYSDRTPKQLLIDAFGELLPEKIWNRPKMGFSLPFDKWMADSNYVNDLMSIGGGDAKFQYKRFLDGKLHWSQLMSLINLASRGYA